MTNEKRLCQAIILQAVQDTMNAVDQAVLEFTKFGVANQDHKHMLVEVQNSVRTSYFEYVCESAELTQAMVVAKIHQIIDESDISIVTKWISVEDFKAHKQAVRAESAQTNQINNKAVA